MERNARQSLIDKMFDAALKEMYSRLAGKYDAGLILEIWTQIAKAGGVQKCFGKGTWGPEMTIQEALDLLDDYCQSIEWLIQKRQKEAEESHEK